MTDFLLDTNVLSETIRKQPSARVKAWLGSLSPSRLYLSSFTIAEIELGIGLHEDSGKAARLKEWLEGTVLPEFAGRILSFDSEAARVYGAWMALGRKTGRPPSATDAQIAAIAYKQGLTVATRNVADFFSLPVLLYNPFD